MRVTIPEAAQTTSSRPGAWTSRSISAETMKIPEPIMDPTTRAVASSRESALTNSACGCWVVAIWRGNLVAPAWCRYVFGPRTPYHVRTTVRLLPREEEFFDLFVEVATRSTLAAQHLRELFDAPPDRRIAHVEAIKRLEHEADQVTHEVVNRLDRTFITPLDREDIHQLASDLDDVMDAIDGTARRSQIFHLVRPRDRPGRARVRLRQRVPRRGELHCHGRLDPGPVAVRGGCLGGDVQLHRGLRVRHSGSQDDGEGTRRSRHRGRDRDPRGTRGGDRVGPHHLVARTSHLVIPRAHRRL